MRAKLILINWVLSFMALSIDTEQSSLWAVVMVVAWFAISTHLLTRAARAGAYKAIEKRFKIDE